MAAKKLKEQVNINDYLVVWYKVLAICSKCLSFSVLDFRVEAIDGVKSGHTKVMCNACNKPKFICILDGAQGRMERCGECFYKFTCITKPDVSDVSTYL